MSKLLDTARRAVVTVGEGRGFVAETYRGRYVVTAAHCLPFFPPSTAAAYTEERTYRELLAPLGEPPSIWAECLFVNPIADLAILGQPDNQQRNDEARAYEHLVDSCETLSITEATMDGRAWLLALDGHWFGCTISHRDGPLRAKTSEAVVAGMSGSPIVSGNGAAVGVVSVSAESGGAPKMECGPGPNLIADLPGWFLREAMRPAERER